MAEVFTTHAGWGCSSDVGPVFRWNINGGRTEVSASRDCAMIHGSCVLVGPKAIPEKVIELAKRVHRLLVEGAEAETIRRRLIASSNLEKAMMEVDKTDNQAHVPETP